MYEDKIIENSKRSIIQNLSYIYFLVIGGPALYIGFIASLMSVAASPNPYLWLWVEMIIVILVVPLILITLLHKNYSFIYPIILIVWGVITFFQIIPLVIIGVSGWIYNDYHKKPIESTKTDQQNDEN